MFVILNVRLNVGNVGGASVDMLGTFVETPVDAELAVPFGVAADRVGDIVAEDELVTFVEGLVAFMDIVVDEVGALPLAV